jgi:hypothetical protein
MKNQIEFKNSTFQNSYATILDWGNSAGLIILMIAFFIYVFGLTTPLIPLENLPDYWNLSLSQYLEKTGAPTGWSWIYHLGKSEYQNYLGIVILGGITFVCYGAMLVHFVRAKKSIFAVLALSELLLLLIASSNILNVSAH